MIQQQSAHVEYQELHRRLVERGNQEGVEFRTEIDGLGVTGEGNYTSSLPNKQRVRRVGLRRKKGGRWAIPEGHPLQQAYGPSRIDFFAEVEDYLYESIVIAHELGHDAFRQELRDGAVAYEAEYALAKDALNKAGSRTYDLRRGTRRVVPRASNSSGA